MCVIDWHNSFQATSVWLYKRDTNQCVSSSLSNRQSEYNVQIADLGSCFLSEPLVLNHFWIDHIPPYYKTANISSFQTSIVNHPPIRCQTKSKVNTFRITDPLYRLFVPLYLSSGCPVTTPWQLWEAPTDCYHHAEDDRKWPSFCRRQFLNTFSRMKHVGILIQIAPTKFF